MMRRLSAVGPVAQAKLEAIDGKERLPFEVERGKLRKPWNQLKSSRGGIAWKSLCVGAHTRSSRRVIWCF